MEKLREPDAPVSAGVDGFLSFLREARQENAMAADAELEANNKTQDILHALELEEHSDEEALALARELGQVRRERRRAKDVREATEPVLAWADSSSAEIRRLERLLGDVRRVEKGQQNRVYIPKAK